VIPTSRGGRIVSGAYVVVVAGLATIGATGDSAGPILIAGLLTLPTSVPAVLGYYVVYGLLAQVPGANPDSGTGSTSCSPSGECHGSSTGDLATWFALTTDVVGILALIVSAVVNIALVGSVFRGRPVASARTRPEVRP
jgi:hypothetical protein